MMFEVLAKEFEKYANSANPEFLKICNRDSSSGGRTDEDAFHHELAQVGNIPGHQDRSDKAQASPECSDGKTWGLNTKASKGVSKGLGKKQDSEEVSRRVIELPNVARSRRTTKVDSREVPRGDNKGKNNKKKFKGRCHKFGKIGHMSKDCRSEETSAFEVGHELADTGCIDMASIFLNVLEIGAVLPPEDPSLRHGTRCIFHQERQKHQGASVPRGQRHEIGI